jgi:hypothetical protein
VSLLLWVLLLAGGVSAIYILLTKVTAQGGNSTRDATEVVELVLGEANAYRGSRSPDDPPLDGENRIAPPITDGVPWAGWGLIRRFPPRR